MLVDVVLMRREGRRRLRADLLREMPVRGELRTEQGSVMEGLVATLTMPGAPSWRLERCNLRVIRGRSLVLWGMMRDGSPHSEQEWWCRLPQQGGGGPVPYDPDPPSGVQRDLSYAPPPWRLPTSVG